MIKDSKFRKLLLISYLKKNVNYLISILKELNIKEISNLMNLSEDLSKLNYDRYQNLLDSN